MKHIYPRCLATVAVVVLGLSVHAVTIPTADLASYAEPVIQLDTASDTTLSAALTAAGKTLGTTGTIVKNGKGTLTVDGTAIASFTGEIHIWEGAWKVTAAGHLGTSDGATYVHGTSNAEPEVKTISPTERPPQLWFATKPSAPANFPGEVIHIAGAGFCRQVNYPSGSGWGWGAIVAPDCSRAVWPSDCPYPWGAKWILDDDATVLLSSGQTDSYLTGVGNVDLELNGHELYIFPSTHFTIGSPEELWGFNQRRDTIPSDWFKSVTPGGSSGKIRAGYALQMNFNSAGGDASNVYCLDGASLYTRNTKAIVDWTLAVTTNDASFLILSYASAAEMRKKNGAWDRRVITEPLRLDGKIRFSSLGSSGSSPSITVTGPVSGPGSIQAGVQDSLLYVWLYLDNPANTFTGGVTVVNGSRLIVGADGSLPADGGPVTLTDSDLTFEFSDVTYRLPDLVLDGTSTVLTATISPESSWKNVRKISEETANWKSLAGAKSLSVEEGVLNVTSSYDTATFAGLKQYIATNVTAGMSFAEFRSRVTNTVLNATGTSLYLQWRPPDSLPDGGAGGYEGWIWWDGDDGDEWTFAAATGPNMMYCAVNGEVLYNCDNHTMHNRVLNTFEDLEAKKVNVRHGWNKFEAFTLKAWGAMESSDKGAYKWPGGKALNVNYAGGESTVSSDYVLIVDKATSATYGKDLAMKTGDATLDDQRWIAQFGDVSVAADAMLTVVDDAPAFGSLGGPGSVVGDVTASNVTASAANLSGALTVTGDVTISDGAKVFVSGARALCKAKISSLPILTATGTLTVPAAIECVATDSRYVRFTARVSDDGKSLLLSLVPAGFVFFAR